MKLEEIINLFKINKYEEIKKAYNINNLPKDKFYSTYDDILSDDQLSIISDLSEDILYNQDIFETDKNRLNLLFNVYDDIPSYYIVAKVVSFITDRAEIKPFLWDKLYSYLYYSDEKRSKSIEYTLAVDYFEDERFVYDIWKHFMNKKFNDTFLKRLLLVIGSVPYDLKEELYIKLLGDKKWHYYIFQSLYESKFHGFQLSEQMNNKKAKKIIDQLELELKNNGKLKEEYDKLISVL